MGCCQQGLILSQLKFSDSTDKSVVLKDLSTIQKSLLDQITRTLNTKRIFKNYKEAWENTDDVSGFEEMEQLFTDDDSKDQEIIVTVLSAYNETMKSSMFYCDTKRFLSNYNEFSKITQQLEENEQALLFDTLCFLIEFVRYYQLSLQKSHKLIGVSTFSSIISQYNTELANSFDLENLIAFRRGFVEKVQELMNVIFLKN